MKHATAIEVGGHAFTRVNDQEAADDCNIVQMHPHNGSVRCVRRNSVSLEVGLLHVTQLPNINGARFVRIELKACQIIVYAIGLENSSLGATKEIYLTTYVAMLFTGF
jgi:hypothetical protein